MGILGILKKGVKNKELIKQGKVLIENKRFIEGVECLTKVLSDKPNNYEALIARARAYCYIEEYDKALDDLNLSINVDSICTSGYFYRGQVNIIKENLYEAIDDFNNVTKVDKRNFLAYLKRGSIYSKLGMFDAAVNNFKALVSIKKRDIRYYELLLSACLAAKNYKDMEKYSKKLIKLNDENPRGYYYLGRMYAAKEENTNAVECFTSSLNRGGNNLDCRYHRGMSYVYLREFNKAVVDFTLGMNLLEEGGGEFYFSRGYSYLKLNEYDKAIEDFEKSIDLKYNIKSCYYNKAAAYIKAKEYKKAIIALNIFIEEEKTFEGAYYDRGFCYRKLKEYEKAIDDYKKAIELKPDREVFYYELSRLYFEINDFDNVIKVLDDAEKIKTWSYKTFSYTLKGDIYFNEKDNMPIAIENYTKSLSVSPTVHAYIQRGRANQRLEYFDLAVKDFNRALELDNESSKAYYYRGNLNYLLNNINEALIDLNLSIKIKETYDAFLLRGKCLFRNKNFNEAIKDYTKSIKLNYYNAEGYNCRAEALKSINSFDEAIKDYKKASQINSNYTSSSYFNIGSILSMKGKPKQAIYYYSKSLDNDSSNYIALLNRCEELEKIGDFNNAINDIECVVSKIDEKDRETKKVIKETLIEISKKTITEQSREKIIRLLDILEK